MDRIAGILLALIVAACLAAPLYAARVSGTDPFRTNIMGALPDGAAVLDASPGLLGVVPVGPGWRGAYALGADGLGRDVAARLLYGGRVSLAIAVVATVACLVLATVLGVLAGQGITALMAWALQLEQSVLIGALSWPVELLAVPVLAFAVALLSSALPAWEAYRVSVFELLESR